jgi:hypothetical protein
VVSSLHVVRSNSFKGITRPVHGCVTAEVDLHIAALIRASGHEPRRGEDRTRETAGHTADYWDQEASSSPGAPFLSVRSWACSSSERARKT